MRKVIIVLIAVMIAVSCTQIFHTQYSRGHDFDLVVDSFYLDGRLHEVRVCTIDQCGKLDTFPRVWKGR